MKARTRALATTLALVVAGAAALLVVWFGVGREDEATAARRTAEAKVLSFRPFDVTAITVTAKGDVTRIVRADAAWTIEAPVRSGADGAIVAALVDRLADLRRTASVAEAPSPEDLARYGLAQPRASVALTLKGGSTETLALGAENPFDGTAFVRAGTGPIALVPGDVRYALERSTFDLRDKAVLHFQRDAVDALRFERGAASFEVRRATAPGRLASYLWTLSSLRAKAFVDETGRRAAQLGLGHPALRVALLGKDARELDRLSVATPREGATYAQASGSPRVVEIDASALEALPRTAKDAEEPKPAAAK